MHTPLQGGKERAYVKHFCESLSAVSTRGGSSGSLGVVNSKRPALPASTNSFPHPEVVTCEAPIMMPFTP